MWPNAAIRTEYEEGADRWKSPSHQESSVINTCNVFIRKWKTFKVLHLTPPSTRGLASWVWRCSNCTSIWRPDLHQFCHFLWRTRQLLLLCLWDPSDVASWSGIYRSRCCVCFCELRWKINLWSITEELNQLVVTSEGPRERSWPASRQQGIRLNIYKTKKFANQWGAISASSDLSSAWHVWVSGGSEEQHISVCWLLTAERFCSASPALSHSRTPLLTSFNPQQTNKWTCSSLRVLQLRYFTGISTRPHVQKWDWKNVNDVWATPLKSVSAPSIK